MSAEGMVMDSMAATAVLLSRIVQKALKTRVNMRIWRAQLCVRRVYECQPVAYACLVLVKGPRLNSGMLHTALIATGTLLCYIAQRAVVYVPERRCAQIRV